MLELGCKVKFVHPEKFDDKEHTILNVQRVHNDVLYFLHYFSWCDEDDLILTEYRNGNRV